MSVIEEIAAERRRQIEREGWTPEHDDAHRPFSLSAAAAAYAIYGGGQVAAETAYQIWPFERQWFKPEGRYPHRKNLVKAAALLVAEIERIDRQKERSERAAPEINCNGSAGATLQTQE